MGGLEKGESQPRRPSLRFRPPSPQREAGCVRRVTMETETERPWGEREEKCCENTASNQLNVSLQSEEDRQYILKLLFFMASKNTKTHELTCKRARGGVR